MRNINDVGDDEFDKYWKRHPINEQHDRSLFINIDRLKIITQGINNLVLVQSLIHKGYVTAYFPLHNENQLYGFDRARHITNTEDREALKIEDLIKEDLVENEKQKIFGESYQFVK